MQKRLVDVNVQELVASAVKALQEVAALDAAADVQGVTFDRGALLNDIEARLNLVEDVLEILTLRQGERVHRLSVRSIPFSVFQVRTARKGKCRCGMCESCEERLSREHNLDLELELLRALMHTK